MTQDHSQGLVEAVVARELARMRRRRDEVRQLLETTMARYESAARFGEELAIYARGDREFRRLVEAVDWAEQREVVGRQLAAMNARSVEESAKSTVVLRWQGGRQQFVAVATDQTLAVTPWMADYDEQVPQGSVYGEGVTYPILFSHEWESNHRALAASMGWAVVLVAAGQQRGGPWQLVGDGDLEVVADGSAMTVDDVPSARRFGFRKRGELWRQVDDFDAVDPQAHWQRWFGQLEKLSETRHWSLREPGGGQVRLEVDAELRRLRILRQPRSTVVRKRHRLFVDPAAPKVRDRYVADSPALVNLLQETARDFVDQGYRVVD